MGKIFGATVNNRRFKNKASQNSREGKSSLHLAKNEEVADVCFGFSCNNILTPLIHVCVKFNLGGKTRSGWKVL